MILSTNVTFAIAILHVCVNCTVNEKERDLQHCAHWEEAVNDVRCKDGSPRV